MPCKCLIGVGYDQKLMGGGVVPAKELGAPLEFGIEVSSDVIASSSFGSRMLFKMKTMVSNLNAKWPKNYFLIEDEYG